MERKVCRLCFQHPWWVILDLRWSLSRIELPTWLITLFSLYADDIALIVLGNPWRLHNESSFFSLTFKVNLVWKKVVSSRRFFQSDLKCKHSNRFFWVNISYNFKEELSVLVAISTRLYQSNEWYHMLIISPRLICHDFKKCLCIWMRSSTEHLRPS